MPDTDFLGLGPATLIGAAIAILLLVIGVVIVLRGRKPAVHATVNLPSVDVQRLGSHGPPEAGTQLECYGAPVRIAATVIAPMGTGGGFPNETQLKVILNRIVPGLGDVFERDQPFVQVWPAQLSPAGFSNSFFANCKLPGERGQGTPWCSVSGKYLDGQVRLLLGVVLCAAAPNSLGEFTIDQPTQWMDLLRIRRNA